jgi:transcriptional regulator with XRE-family HTH domain
LNNEKAPRWGAFFLCFVDFATTVCYNGNIFKKGDLIVKDLKPIIAKNITSLRQAAQMTQSELAERLNYSDKAVSKWERGESVPDITVLKEIADLFGVTVDALICEHDGAFAGVLPQQTEKKYHHSRPVITTLSILLVWFVALLVYVVLDAVPPLMSLQWLVFVYAIPVSMIVWLVLNAIWFDSKWNYLIVSGLMWSGLLSIVLTFGAFGINLWKLLLLGIVGQAGIVLWSKIRYKLPKK